MHVVTQKMSKSGFFCNDQKSRFSPVVEQRVRNTSCRPIMTEEIFKKIEWSLSSLNEVRLIVLLQETNNFDEINNFFIYNYCKDNTSYDLFSRCATSSNYGYSLS